jgi:hydroxyethylthiazole kinase
MVGGVVAACAAAAPEEIWLAVITAICGFNIAGERALRMGGDRPGSFKVLLMDNLFQLRGEDLIKEGKVNWLA